MFIEPMLPTQKHLGRPPTPHRSVFNAMLYIVKGKPLVTAAPKLSKMEDGSSYLSKIGKRQSLVGIEVSFTQE